MDRESPDPESLLLGEEEEELSEKQLLQPPPPALKRTRRDRRQIQTWLHGAALVFYLALAIVLYTWSVRLRATQKSACACEAMADLCQSIRPAAPAQEAVEYEQVTITHNLEDSESKYRGEPSPEIDAAWDEQQPPRLGRGAAGGQRELGAAERRRRRPPGDARRLPHAALRQPRAQGAVPGALPEPEPARAGPGARRALPGPAAAGAHVPRRRRPAHVPLARRRARALARVPHHPPVPPLGPHRRLVPRPERAVARGAGPAPPDPRRVVPRRARG
ncbi:hypothetical protein IF1G_07774 [Cordyceps javanica]|uniref:Uncharacterized protein n=1 Tax=Cordyceps javanica TaxID=43265 RepID=A0A545UUR2_9HYPO|nr:hypothetical protein IF1G_07774 [Cordyceps javanica]